jgi:hypothetical protein
MEEKIHVNDESADKTYFTMIPNIILKLGLSPHCIAYYLLLKSVAGDRGKCFMAIKSMAQQLNCSDRQIQKMNKILSKPLLILKGKSLIRINSQKKPDGNNATNVITITDIWLENTTAINEFKKIYTGEHGSFSDEFNLCVKTPNQSNLPMRESDSPPGESGSPPGELRSPPGEPGSPKEDIYNKNSLRKEDTLATSESEHSEVADKISFSFNSYQFENISSEDIESWKQSFPQVDIVQQINQSQEYIKSRPTTYKRRRNFRRFLTDWFARNQEKANSPSFYEKKSSYATYSRKSELDKMAQEILERNRKYDEEFNAKR